ncbi:MAG: hypothetical protein QGI09_00245 [Dehalococcoidia bacterium]|nr:hypothetical protein [Dehalococcoidia bacterium]
MDKTKLKIREGQFRSYEVSSRQILAGTKKLLKAAGYVFLPTKHIGLVKPTFRAKREWQEGSNEIVGIVRSSIKKAIDGFVYLAAARSVLGDSVEYALVLPPINEYLLLEFLQGDDAKIAFNSKYLADVLSVLKQDEVALETTSPSSPGVLRPLNNDGYIHVVMPMFVQW